MGADFWTIKTQARRDIHAAFSVTALYQDATMPTATEVHVRWHNRHRPLGPFPNVGNLPGGDYADVFELVDHVIFNTDELASLGIVPMRNASLTFPQFGNFKMVLDVREPTDGPIKQTWTLQRPKQVSPSPSAGTKWDGGSTQWDGGNTVWDQTR
jgi:hypothetical protein